MRDNLSDEEIIQVLYFIGKRREDPIAYKILKLKKVERNKEGIRFGLAGVIGCLVLSWKEFDHYKKLLDNTENNKS